MKTKQELIDLIDENKDFTDFQRKVYKAILDIPRGEVRSYKWVALKIRRPGAFRAVGQALKKNPYTVIVPCHRVVRADGGIGGYSRGVEMKNKLLRKERQ
jgi:methylated-DNA-[protein]-cysteine S-methyltransferase